MGLRARISARAALAQASARRGALDWLLAEGLFWRHHWRLLGKPARLAEAHRNVVGHRLTMFEAMMLRDHLPEVVARRGELFLQADLRALNLTHGRATPAIDSKIAFAAACASHGLPHVATFALGPDRVLPADASLPLFVKPDIGNRARGCAVLETGGANGTARLLTGKVVREGSLADLLAAHCPGEVLLAQPVLANHPDMAALVGPGAMTLRLVTGLAAGEAQLLSALVEIPLDDARPLARRWTMLPVDRESGMLAEAAPGLPQSPDPHPLTGVRLSGAIIAAWQEARACVLRAHVLIAPDVPMVGWDLAIAPGGPVLIEGNANWAIPTHCRNAAGFDLAPALRFAEFAARVRG